MLAEHHGLFREWTDSERLHRFVALKNKNYEHLNKFISNYDFLGVNTALMFVFGLDNSTGLPLVKSTKEHFTNGTLKIKPGQIRVAGDHADLITQIIDRRPEEHLIHHKKPMFLKALLLLVTHPNFDPKKLAKEIDKSSKGLESLTNWQETLERMVILYNGTSRTKKIKFDIIMDKLNKKRNRLRHGSI